MNVMIKINMITRKCEKCHSTFLQKPTEAPRKFCNSTCEKLAWKTHGIDESKAYFDTTTNSWKKKSEVEVKPVSGMDKKDVI
jgi:hypothetical protein